MPTNAAILDGSLVVGATDLNIAGVLYPTKNLKFQFPSTVVQDMNSAGQVTGEVLYPDTFTGSGTCKYPTNSSNRPHVGDAVTVILAGSGETLSCKVSEVSQELEARGICQLPVTLRQKIN